MRAQVFGYQVDNGIPIASWYHDRADREFTRLIPLLERLAAAPDVRPLIARHSALHRCAPLPGPSWEMLNVMRPAAALQ